MKLRLEMEGASQEEQQCGIKAAEAAPRADVDVSNPGLISQIFW